jgi:precorrin-2 methylase
MNQSYHQLVRNITTTLGGAESAAELPHIPGFPAIQAVAASAAIEVTKAAQRPCSPRLLTDNF